MKKYIGTKTIMAKPMAKSEAEKVLNRSLADAKGGEDGYFVEYPDGYNSWSPKETFEEAYKIADTYLDRLQIERDELKERYDKLSNLENVDTVKECGSRHAWILSLQHTSMGMYLDHLETRIKLLKDAPSQTQG